MVINNEESDLVGEQTNCFLATSFARINSHVLILSVLFDADTYGD